MAREFTGTIPRSERLLFTTPSFDPAKADWKRGAQRNFDERFKTDDWLVKADSLHTNIFHVRVVHTNGIEFTLYDAAGARVSDGRAGVWRSGPGSGGFPTWTWSGTGEGVLYTDDFPSSPSHSMFAIALVRSPTNGITEVTNRLGTLRFGRLPYEAIGN
ncbi:MAG: hypothetical protein ABMA26_07660 [Limisphaerales bacterium]